MRDLRPIVILLALLVSAGCQTFHSSPPEIPEAAEADQSLTLIVARLQMHLRDDTYRSARSTGTDGRSVFASSLWQLDRLQGRRNVPEDQWANVDVVIEYARARSLERLRRYREATEAYERVAANGSLLTGPAADARHVMSRFARHSGPPQEPPIGGDEQIQWLDRRVEKWQELAWEYRGTSYESLALEESEAWGQARVEALLRHRSVDAAISSCHLLIERHRASKRYARHLIRVGDLNAEAARREYLTYGVTRDVFDTTRYDAYLDRALSAYELAREQRRPSARTEANKKIEALIAVHEGVSAGVR
jgi:tetratricopeptide (TPR) repeat protein